MTTDVFEQRLREHLAAWADEAPVARDRLEEIEAAPGRSTRRTLGVLPAAAAIVLVLLVATLLAWDRDEPPTIAGPDRPDRAYVGTTPGVRGLVAGGGSLWATSAPDEAVYEIDPASGEVRRSIDVGSHAEGITYDDGTLWLTAFDPDELVEVDTSTGEVVRRIPMTSPWGATVAFGAVWVGDTDSLAKVDPETGAVVRWPVGGRSVGVSLAVGDRLWIADPEDGSVSVVDPTDGDVEDVVNVGGEPRSLVEAAGAVWVASAGNDRVSRIDPDERRRIDFVDVGALPHSLEVVGDELWVTEHIGGTLTRIDTRSGAVVATHPIGIRPGAMAAVGDDVWVAMHREGALLRLPAGGPSLVMPAPSIEQRVVVAGGHLVYVRCSGTGSPTVVLDPDVWGVAGDWAAVEALLAPHVRVCVTDRSVLSTLPFQPPSDIPSLAARTRDALEQVGERGPFLVVSKGDGAMVARQLAATWDEVVALVLVDANPETLPADAAMPGEEEPVEALRSSWDAADALDIDVPVTVVISGAAADGPFDARVARDPAVRQRWIAAHEDLAERFGTRLVVIDGDEWVPTYRPDRLVEVILAAAE